MSVDPGIDEVRRAAAEALGDSRLERVGPDEPLLASGLVTSIEVVSILVELEAHFSVSIPDSRVVSESLTLASLARALVGSVESFPVGGSRSEVPQAHPIFKRFLRRPLVGALSVVCSLAVLDLAVRGLVETLLRNDYAAFLENGRRLYPYAGNFSQDDFRFALSHHEARTRPPTREDDVVAVFGDSGTIGSYVEASESIPERLEQSLGASNPSIRVLSLAWYGQLLPKDVMLLELVWDQPMNAAVFTLGNAYFSRSSVDRWIREFPHVTVNAPLFRDFVERVPSAERAPFHEVLELLEDADRAHWGALRRWGFEHLALMHYRPYLQYLLKVRLLPAMLGSDMRWASVMERNERYALRSPPQDILYGLSPQDVDRRQAAILKTVVDMLRQRGVLTVLYLEPQGPSEWKPAANGQVTAADIAARIAAATECVVVDMSWSLQAGDFLDSAAHYTPEANRRIAEAIASAIRGRRGE